MEQYQQKKIKIITKCNKVNRYQKFLENRFF